MAVQQFVISLAVLCLLPYFSSADTCLNPQVNSQVYTSTEAHMSYETVIVIQFSLTCKNGLKDLNLYAEFQGKTVPASKGPSNQYQISFVGEHKNIPSGLYNIEFYDEEGYADLRKAQRSGEDTTNIKSVFSVDVNHKGSSFGPSIHSEFAATIVAILVFYLAHNARTKLQA